MTSLEIFLAIAVAIALAGVAVVSILLRRCIGEIERNRQHLSLLEQDTDGQFEVLDRIDRIIHSRTRAILHDGEVENSRPLGLEDDRA